MFQVEDRGNGVVLLRMDDGKVNAIGPEFLLRFGKAWREATVTGKAVVITGNAKAFSAGLDLKVLPTLSREDLFAFSRGFMALFRDVLAYDRPVVAAVDGPALAGGAILALCGDLRLVAPGARLGVTEMPVGIPFPPPVLALVRDRLPPQEAWPALLQGVIRQGDACIQAGWAHRHVERARLVDEAVAAAAELGAFNPVAYRLAKAQLSDTLVAAFSRFEKEGAEAWVDLLADPQTLGAIVAYFERVTARR